MTSPVPPLTSAKPIRRHRRLPALFLLVVLVGTGIGAYFIWRLSKAVIPTFHTEGLDDEVVSAINNARTEVEAQPDSGTAWGRLGMVLFAQNLYLDCIGVFAEAERLDPANARWPYFRGLALLLVRPEEEGLVALERASQIAPPSLHVRLRLAEQYLKYDRIDAADAVFLELLSEYPTNPRVLLGHGQILSRRGKWQDAVAPLRSAARHPTSQHEAHLALATAYFRLGKTAEAERENVIANAGPKDADWPDSFRAKREI